MLLDKKVNTRCCKVSTLKGTSFFKGFDWNKLLDFSIPPPFLPLEFPLDKSLLNSRESFERKIVLDEDEYVEAIGKVIERDYFPDLDKYRSYLEVRNSC